MALIVVKDYTSMSRQIRQDICNLSFVFFDIFLTRGIDQIFQRLKKKVSHLKEKQVGNGPSWRHI